VFLIHNSSVYDLDWTLILSLGAAIITANFEKTPYHGKVHQVKGHSQLRYLINRCRLFPILRLAKLKNKKYYAPKFRFLETGKNYRIFFI